MIQHARMCVGCRQLDARTHMVRIIASQATCQVDEKADLSGRGAWIHPDLRCFDRAIRAHAFDRAFRQRGLDGEPVRHWIEKKGSGTETPELTREKKAGRNPMGTQ